MDRSQKNSASAQLLFRCVSDFLRKDRRRRERCECDRIVRQTTTTTQGDPHHEIGSHPRASFRARARGGLTLFCGFFAGAVKNVPQVDIKRRRFSRSVRRQASSTLLPTVCARVISATSDGKLVRSEAQSRNDERKPCAVRPSRFLRRSSISKAILDSGFPFLPPGNTKPSALFERDRRITYAGAAGRRRDCGGMRRRLHWLSLLNVVTSVGVPDRRPHASSCRRCGADHRCGGASGAHGPHARQRHRNAGRR
jgi:hypothetical protein